MLTLHEVITFLVSMQISISSLQTFFFFNDTATTEIYTLSLHDALPISKPSCLPGRLVFWISWCPNSLRRKIIRQLEGRSSGRCIDRKSTRLNSSHGYISYAVFCLKKK